MTALDPDSASAQLRVIRSLMERATIYRSLSAPTALVGGLLSFGGLGLAYAADHVRGQPLSEREFLAIWLTILVLTGATNAFVLWREAQRRGTAFFSSGMKCAFKSLLPPFLCAGFITVGMSAPETQLSQVLVLVWTLFYGLGLLAMQHFAPRSLVVLGWAFVLSIPAGLLVVPFLPLGWRPLVWESENDHILQASWWMALTFGLFHVIYAIAVWAIGEERTDSPAVSPNGAENV